MVLLSPVLVVMVYLAVVSFFYCALCYVWWSGKRGFSF